MKEARPIALQNNARVFTPFVFQPWLKVAGCNQVQHWPVPIEMCRVLMLAMRIKYSAALGRSLDLPSKLSMSP